MQLVPPRCFPHLLHSDNRPAAAHTQTDEAEKFALLNRFHVG
jgi:hypothetical protein